MHVIRGNRVERALGHIEMEKDGEERRVGGVLTCTNNSMSEISCLLYGPTVLGNFFMHFLMFLPTSTN